MKQCDMWVLIQLYSFLYFLVCNKHKYFYNKNMHTQIYANTHTCVHALAGLLLLWKTINYDYMNKSLGLFSLQCATESQHLQTLHLKISTCNFEQAAFITMIHILNPYFFSPSMTSFSSELSYGFQQGV